MGKVVVSAIVLFLSAAGPALAQEAAPKTALLTTPNAPKSSPPGELSPPRESSPPAAPEAAPSTPPAIAPPLYVIPPPLPAYIDVSEIEALEESGHDQVMTGNLLLAAAGAVGVTGIGLLIASSSAHSCTSSTSADGRLVYESCGSSALGSAGGFGILLGVLLTIPGSSLQESGQRDLERAAQLRRNACNLCVRPKFSREGAGAEVALKF